MARPSAGGARTRPQRKRKVAERVRVVDAAQLADARARRLDALENDNFAAEAEGVDEGDVEYNPLDEDAARKRGKRAKRRRGRNADDVRGTGIARWNKPLAVALAEELHVGRPEGMVAYADIAAAPSTRPSRPFCSVCGFRAPYTCTRCAVRFCSLKCGSVHDETRCLKFTM